MSSSFWKHRRLVARAIGVTAFVALALGPLAGSALARSDHPHGAPDVRAVHDGGHGHHGGHDGHGHGRYRPPPKAHHAPPRGHVTHPHHRHGHRYHHGHVRRHWIPGYWLHGCWVPGRWAVRGHVGW